MAVEVTNLLTTVMAGWIVFRMESLNRQLGDFQERLTAVERELDSRGTGNAPHPGAIHPA